MKRLYAHIICEDVRAKTLFGFFNISKYVKYCIQKKESYASRSQNTTDLLYFEKYDVIVT
jgi:hypothetical protein